MSCKTVTASLLLVAGLVLPGCESVNDAFGLSKANTPDETQVTVNRSLAIPPDYSLRPPAEGSNAQAAAAAPSAAPTQPQNTTAQSITPPVTATTQENTGQSAAVTPTDQNTQTASAQANGGISTTRPDGTKKTPEEIRQEARQKQIERERAKNPDYGTWKNIFNW